MVEMTVPQRVTHPKTEAAFLLGISLRKLELMIASKELRTVRIGKRRLIPRSEIERLAREAR
jgi:excisionase family DNA binding protein